MRLTDEAIQKYIAMREEHLGRRITVEEAHQEATGYIDFYDVILKPLVEETAAARKAAIVRRVLR